MSRRQTLLLLLLLVASFLTFEYVGLGAGTRPKLQTDPGLQTELQTDPGLQTELQTGGLSNLSNVIIWTTWRSGSTFLGNLVSSALPDTFYSYEPFFNKGVRKFSDPYSALTSEVMGLLKDLLTCDMKTHSQFVGDNARFHFPIFANPFYMDRCYATRECGEVAPFERACRAASLRVIKTVRLGVTLAEQILYDHKFSTTKLVYLIRDPRAAIRSTRAQGPQRWCSTPDCYDVTTVCRQLTSDLKAARTFQEVFPERFRIMRYEDLSLNTEEEVDHLFKFLDLPQNLHFRRYLNQSTKGKISPRDQYLPTTRHTLNHTFEWREDIGWGLCQEVQRECDEVLADLGWRVFQNPDQLRDMELSVFVNQ